MTMPHAGAILQFVVAGAVFGAALALFLLIFQRIRSLLAGLLLVAISSTAFTLAFLASVLVLRFPLPTFGHSITSTSLTMIFVGGMVGGFLISAALVGIVRSPSQVPERILVKAGIGSALGAVTATIGWALGPSLGSGLWSMFPVSAVPQPDSFNFYSLYFLWHPIMAAYLGYATRTEPRRLPSAQPISRRLVIAAIGIPVLLVAARLALIRGNLA